MKIAWDIKEIFGQKAGKGCYTYKLLKYFIKYDQNNEYYLYFGEQKLPFKLPRNFHHIQTPDSPLIRYFFQFFDLKKKKIDLLFSSTSYILPSFAPCKTFLIIYDFAVYHSFTRPALKTLLIEKIALGRSIRKASRLATISTNTKKEIQKLFKIPDSKIDVVYAGVDNPLTITNDDTDKTLKKLKIKKRFILFVGTIEPRKNVKNLIKAYSLLPPRIKKEYQLVLVGKKGWRADEIYDEAKKLKDRVKFLGYLKEKELAALYKKTTLFIYPSFYEGFGLPILEAMSYGSPVITSNATSMPEVAGDAAIMINPWRIKEITQAMEKIINNQNLREELIQKGYKQTNRFSWRKCAKKVLSSINNLT